MRWINLTFLSLVVLLSMLASAVLIVVCLFFDILTSLTDWVLDLLNEFRLAAYKEYFRRKKIRQ